MRRTLLYTLLLAGGFAATALAQSPASELQAAVADIERLPADVRLGVRYLSLYSIPRERRRGSCEGDELYAQRGQPLAAIVTPRRITPTLLRFSISNYINDGQEFSAWSAAWEKLVEADPYWHLRTEVLAVSGQSSPAHQAPTGRPATSAVTIDADWVGAEAATRLRNYTGSTGAILRADDFVARATIAPNYYALAGIPASESEFLKSLGVDAATIDRLRGNAGANLLISGVTQKPRRIIWQQGPLGGVYETLDIQQVDAARDPVRRPLSVGELSLQYDAGEWFALGPNGLWRVALYDSAGKQQQSVPDRIAKDTSDPHGDGIVTPLISCIRCHTESGLRPFRDDQTRLLRSGRVDLRSYDPLLVRRAAEFYDEPRLQRQMEFDRETYARSVSRGGNEG